MRSAITWMQRYIAGASLTDLEPSAQLDSMATIIYHGYGRGRPLRECMPVLRAQLATASPHELEALVNAMVSLTGQELSCQHLSKLIGRPPKEILRWLMCAQRAGVWHRLTSFDRQSELVDDRTKGYIIDVAAASRLLGITSAEELAEDRRWGALFETWVVNQLVVLAAEIDKDIRVYFWRTQHGEAEVDVVLGYKQILYPIEIKSKVSAARSNAAKIARLRERYAATHTVAPGLIIYAGDRLHFLDEQTIAFPAFLLQ